MKIKIKIQIIFTALFLLNSFNIAAQTSKVLADYLLSRTEITDLFLKVGIKGTNQNEIKYFLDDAVEGLTHHQFASKEKLLKTLSQLPNSNEKDELLKLLQLPSEKIKEKDLVTAINHLVYLASKDGKMSMLSCTDCTDSSLRAMGFLFSVSKTSNKNINDLLSKTIPKDPKGLNLFIQNGIKRHQLKDYENFTLEMIAPEEWKTFAVFIALLDKGNEELKDLAISIKEFRQNKLWRIFSYDMSEKETIEWAKVIRSAEKLKQEENLSSEDAFFKTILKNGDENLETIKKLRKLKSSKCFF